MIGGSSTKDLVPFPQRPVSVAEFAQFRGVLTGFAGTVAVADLGASPDDIEAVGQCKEPELEKIAALEPDLILGNESGLSQIYDQLSEIAPTVFTVGAPDNWREDCLLPASALGKTEQAKENLDDLASRAGDIASLTDPSNTTVSLLRIQEDRVRSMGSLATAGMAMADIGFLRPETAPADEISEDLSRENVDSADGDVVIYGSLGNIETWDEGDVPVEIQRLAAVSRNDAIAVDDEVWFQNAGVIASGRILGETKTIVEEHLT